MKKDALRKVAWRRLHALVNLRQQDQAAAISDNRMAIANSEKPEQKKQKQTARQGSGRSPHDGHLSSPSGDGEAANFLGTGRKPSPGWNWLIAGTWPATAAKFQPNFPSGWSAVSNGLLRPSRPAKPNVASPSPPPLLSSSEAETWRVMPGDVLMYFVFGSVQAPVTNWN